MEVNLVEFRGVQVELIKGSSKLLSFGKLPIGNVELLESRVNKEDYTDELLIDFINTFGKYPIKAGVIRDLESNIKKLIGLKSSTKEKISSNSKIKNIPAEIPKSDIPIIFPRSGKCKNLNIFTMMGISATGKGTRLSTLILYLIEELKLKYEIISFIGFTQHKNGIGYYFPDIKTIFFGKWVKSNKSGALLSWSSHDWLQAITYKNLNHYDFMRESCNSLEVDHIVYEGYPCMSGWDNTVNNIFKDINNVNMHIQYYYYPVDKEVGFELLQDRVVGRSGARIKGTCWAQNHLYIKVYNEHVQDLLDEKTSGSAQLLRYDDPVFSFGSSFLEKIELKDNIENFKSWCLTNNTIRNISNSEDNSRRLSFYYENQLPTLLINLEDICTAQKETQVDGEQNIPSEIIE